jgi:Flp pilus assembly pilin Flp
MLRRLSFRKLWDDRRAIAALEYTLILVVIGAVAITGSGILGNSLTTSYNSIGAALSGETARAASGL